MHPDKAFANSVCSRSAGPFIFLCHGADVSTPHNFFGICVRRDGPFVEKRMDFKPEQGGVGLYTRRTISAMQTQIVEGLT